MKSINCKGKLIDLSVPKVMGIINVTPDSFYEGSRAVSEEDILSQAQKMLEEGATFLDVGGYSSRPGASPVSQEEELRRVIPAITAISETYPEALISVDTFRSEVAKEVIAMGAAMINDISAGSMDETMMETIASLQVPYIMMHMRGTVQTRMESTDYENLTEELLFYFSKKIARARSLGINDLIADPGFGFSKTIDQNFELLNALEYFKELQIPLLVGLSRKSMIYKTLNSSPEEALNGSTALQALALYKGASIVRVHDVKPAIETIRLISKLNVSPN